MPAKGWLLFYAARMPAKNTETMKKIYPRSRNSWRETGVTVHPLLCRQQTPFPLIVAQIEDFSSRCWCCRACRHVCMLAVLSGVFIDDVVIRMMHNKQTRMSWRPGGIWQGHPSPCKTQTGHKQCDAIGCDDTNAKRHDHRRKLKQNQLVLCGPA